MSLAAIAALGLPVTSIIAQPSDQTPGTKDRTDREALLAGAQAKLAWALIDLLATRGGGTDTILSPASVAAAFGLVAMGASPAMKAAMVKVLGFGPANVDDSLEALAETRSYLANAGGAFQSVSRIVFAPSSPPNKIFRAGLESLKIDYSIDDLAKPEAAAKIDGWVREVTQGAIPEILGGPIEKSAFVALNALHFKGRWLTPFDPKLTAQAPFHGVNGTGENAAMMRLGSAKRSFRKERNFIAVDLPFSEQRFSLIVVTTTDKPAGPREFTKVAHWLSGSGFARRSGTLALPRFSMSAREDLIAVLDSLGLDKARHSKTALQGFAPGLILSQVVQRAMIDVDEEGAEAAAATAVMGDRSLTIDDEIEMVVDKPFIFALRDRDTGLIPVAGYVSRSPNARAA